MTEYIFGAWIDGGKLMGLAPFGNADSYPSFLDPDADPSRFSDLWKLQFNWPDLSDKLNYRDLAARVEKDFHTLVLERIDKACRFTPKGGVIFTAEPPSIPRSTTKCAESTRIAAFFFFPAANDAGISAGSAYAARFRMIGQRRLDGCRAAWNERLGCPI